MSQKSNYQSAKCCKVVTWGRKTISEASSKILEVKLHYAYHRRFSITAEAIPFSVSCTTWLNRESYYIIVPKEEGKKLSIIPQNGP
jgi:hypothetical protein